jgi:hypothetical protein
MNDAYAHLVTFGLQALPDGSYNIPRTHLKAFS